MSLRRPSHLAAIIVLAAFGLGACAEMGMMKKDEMMEEVSLYDRLGGQPAIVAVVGEFAARLAADPRINQRFAGTDLDNLKRLLVEQVCAATGGPCTYSGRDMKTTHAGMNITDDEFAWTGEHLAGALDKFSVPDKEKGELLGAIGSMQGDIVGQ